MRSPLVPLPFLAASLLFPALPSTAAAADLMPLLTSVPVIAEDDRVMGGVSRSRPRLHRGAVVFTGRLSRDQGGGFASVEAENRGLGAALADSRGVRLRVRGDGRVYQLRFRQQGLGDSLWYRASFRPPVGEVGEVRLSWDRFRASYHGELQPEAPPLVPGAIRGLALLTSDGPEGRFFLRVSGFRALPG